MNELNQAVKSGEELLAELKGTPRPSAAPTMGVLKKVAYTHEAMINLIIEGSQRPGGISQKEIAAHFGYTEGWISNVFASDAFQARLAARREELLDPVLRASIEERFRALTIRSLEILQAKLNAPVVSDQVALRAAELGAKALGVGGHAPPKTPETDRLERLASRLISLQSHVRERVINGEVLEVSPVQQG